MGEILESWDKAKAWYKSKTIIGVLIAALGALVKTFLPEVDLDGAVDVVLTDGDVLANGLDSIWGSALEIIGLAVATWGRLTAKVRIKPLAE